jgi:hypothetical protein
MRQTWVIFITETHHQHYNYNLRTSTGLTAAGKLILRVKSKYPDLLMYSVANDTGMYYNCAPFSEHSGVRVDCLLLLAEGTVLTREEGDALARVVAQNNIRSILILTPTGYCESGAAPYVCADRTQAHRESCMFSGSIYGAIATGRADRALAASGRW